uniref:Transmembrane protein n=1 Tax=Peronospora matthiolae TaxID=2874970 RepID=A0AAV1TBI3_9STRA
MVGLIIVALGVTVFAAVALWLHHAPKRLENNTSTTSTRSSDDEDEVSAAPLSVDVVADLDERGSLLPKLAGLLRSPSHKVATRIKQEPVMMRAASRPARSGSLTLPLGARTKQSENVPAKKVHVPYFYPLLDETAKWWQTQQCRADNLSELVQDEEPEADQEEPVSGDKWSTELLNKNTPMSTVLPKELIRLEDNSVVS